MKQFSSYSILSFLTSLYVPFVIQRLLNMTRLIICKQWLESKPFEFSISKYMVQNTRACCTTITLTSVAILMSFPDAHTQKKGCSIIQSSQERLTLLSYQLCRVNTRKAFRYESLFISDPPGIWLAIWVDFHLQAVLCVTF